MQSLRLLLGDCKERMKELPDNSVGSIISDPPYLIFFMGSKWDTTIHNITLNPKAICALCQLAPGKCKCEDPAWFVDGEPVEESLTLTQMQDNQEWHRQWLVEAFRVLKPGGKAKIFSATRTYHRLARAMEQVGFVCLCIEGWAQAQGFPKSLNVSKAVDSFIVKGKVDNLSLGGPNKTDLPVRNNSISNSKDTKEEPLTEEGKRWLGFGTALKPAIEPFVCGTKPLRFAERNLYAKIFQKPRKFWLSLIPKRVEA